MPLRHIRYAAFAIGLMLSAGAMAHSPLTAVTPEDGARLTAPPAAIEMRFRDPSRLIRFALVGVADGAEIGLGDAHLMVKSADHTVILPALAAGRYTASWRAMSQDGHVIKGRFSFTVAPE